MNPGLRGPDVTHAQTLALHAAIAGATTTSTADANATAQALAAEHKQTLAADQAKAKAAAKNARKRANAKKKAAASATNGNGTAAAGATANAAGNAAATGDSDSDGGGEAAAAPVATAAPVAGAAATANGDATEQAKTPESKAVTAGTADGAAAASDEKKSKKKKKKPAASASPAGATAAPTANGAAAATAATAAATAAPTGNVPTGGVTRGGGIGGGVDGKAVAAKKQTSPPTVPVSELYPSKAFPLGEVVPHFGDHNTYRITSAEKKALDRVGDEWYNDMREAAEVHRVVRQDLQKWLKPGLSLTDICNRIEGATKTLIKADGMKRGWGFPTGVSVNHCAAHFSPNSGDKSVLQHGDVLKVDFGVHVNGRIVDSAFTWTFDPKYDNLLKAVRAATNAGVAAAGIDARMTEIGAAIQEVMESYEVTIGGKTYPVKAIRGLCGHTIAPYMIHGGGHGKSVPSVPNGDNSKMEEGEVYAIETFGSIMGKGQVYEEGECSHYMKHWNAKPSAAKGLRSAKARELLAHIDKTFGTLPFCRRWLDAAGQKAYLLGLKQLVDADIVMDCPPLCDIKGSYVAQFEHTFILRPTCKEVVSRGVDY